MQLFIFLCSRFHSGLFLCFRRLPVYPIFIQVSGSAMISSLPVQQRDLFPSSQQADCFLFGDFFLVWVMWWYFLLFFVLFQFVCLFLNSCIPFCSEMDSQKIENPLNVWLPWIPWCCCQEDDQSLGRLTTKLKPESMPLQLRITTWMYGPGPQEDDTKWNSLCCWHTYPVLQVTFYHQHHSYFLPGYQWLAGAVLLWVRQ